MGKIEQGTSCWNITSGTGVKEVRDQGNGEGLWGQGRGPQAKGMRPCGRGLAGLVQSLKVLEFETLVFKTLAFSYFLENSLLILKVFMQSNVAFFSLFIMRISIKSRETLLEMFANGVPCRRDGRTTEEH